MDVALSLPPAPAPRMSPLAERVARENAIRPPVDESTVDPARRAAIRKAADEFETTFINQMLGHMFDGVPVDETFGGGHGEEQFRSFLTNEYAKQVQRRGGFGIADQVYRELLKTQEV